MKQKQTKNHNGPRREKSVFVVESEEQMRRPVCAPAQSDQRRCYSPSVKYSSQRCSMSNFNILASLAGLSLALSEIPRTYFLATPKSIVITKNNTINHYSSLYKMLSCKNRFHMHKNAINP